MASFFRSILTAVDRAIIATPVSTVPDIIGEGVDAGVKGMILLSAGFKEAGIALSTDQ